MTDLYYSLCMPRSTLSLLHFNWDKHAANPVLAPDPALPAESHACMTPVMIQRGDEYWLYYAGGDKQNKRRICLAIAPCERPAEFRRLGPILDVGADDDFDAKWMVCPRPYRVGDQWYMIYTGLPKEGWSRGLQSIKGLGMAVSNDGLQWKKLGSEPSLTGDHFREFPGNTSIGGGGPPLRVESPDGSVHYRLYCSLPVGHPSTDLTVDQKKLAMVCHSQDGRTWSDFRIIMVPRPEISREDCAANYPVVWRDGDLFRCLYCCIGTRWGAYSIAEAVSRDGYEWYRGNGGDDNLSLAPTEDDSWEGKMTCYPSLVFEPGRVRMVYNGNGYGGTGIGMATAPLPA